MTKLDKIYDSIEDDFESRTCENCDYYSSQVDCIVKMVNFLDITTFSCNAWELLSKPKEN